MREPIRAWNILRSVRDCHGMALFFSSVSFFLVCFEDLLLSPNIEWVNLPLSLAVIHIY